MMSIFTVYSQDRKQQLEQMIECMQDMNHYDACQKMLVVDGDYGEETNVKPEGWEISYVKRCDGVFNWANMWKQGVANARNDVVLYLDSDRVLPKDYFDLVMDRIEDDRFLFTGDLFTFLQPVETKVVKWYRDTLTPKALKDHYDSYKELLWYDPRFRLPCHGPGKGVMSGSTAFTKATYHKSGGVDPWYVGTGAYADSDFHQQCYDMGMEMINLGVLELHLWHEKISGTNLIDRMTLESLSLINYIRYCLKWEKDLDLARRISKDLKLNDNFVFYTCEKIKNDTILPCINYIENNGVQQWMKNH